MVTLKAFPNKKRGQLTAPFGWLRCGNSVERLVEQDSAGRWERTDYVERRTRVLEGRRATGSQRRDEDRAVEGAEINFLEPERHDGSLILNSIHIAEIDLGIHAVATASGVSLSCSY